MIAYCDKPFFDDHLQDREKKCTDFLNNNIVLE